jgi:hypothetical protein
MPPMPSGLGTDPSKKQMHSRSSSGQRLVARNAATIKENENEEDEELLDGPKGKKESLADMFASEPKDKGRRTSGSRKRVVPAVVLGSPPPQESSTLTSYADDSIGRKTKRNDLMVSTVPPSQGQGQGQGSVRSTAPSTTAVPAKPRGRSEAQELADFFSSTEPPPNTLAPPSPVPDEPPKSAKSFKSFMSRMTGKKVSKENERPPMPSAFSQAPPTGVKRQKSFGSFKSNPASPPLGNAESFSPMMTSSNSFTSPQATSPPDRGVSSFVSPPPPSQPERVPSYNTPSQPTQVSPKSRDISTFTTPSQPPVSKDRSASHAASDDARSEEEMRADNFLATGVAAMSMGAGEQTKAVSPEKRMDELASYTPHDASVKKEEHAQFSEQGLVTGATVPKFQSNSDTLPPPRPPRLNGTSQRSIRPAVKDQIPALAPPLSTSADEYVVVNKSDAMPTPIITNTTRDADNTSPIRQTPSTAAQSHFASDAVSFRTASEGTTPPSHHDESAPTRPETFATQESKQTNNIPSIPISDLVPLRGLLQHATSARECQLLLSAILSQLGIPHSASSHDEGIDPESRVTAWLLAGREGPIEYPYPSIHSPRSTTETATGTSQSQILATPPLTNVDLDVGKVVANGQGGSDGVNGAERDRDTAIGDGVTQSKDSSVGVEGEQWVGAVRVPGDDESNRVRAEVVGV